MFSSASCLSHLYQVVLREDHEREMFARDFLRYCGRQPKPREYPEHCGIPSDESSKDEVSPCNTNHREQHQQHRHQQEQRRRRRRVWWEHRTPSGGYTDAWIRGGRFPQEAETHSDSSRSVQGKYLAASEEEIPSMHLTEQGARLQGNPVVSSYSAS